MGRTENSVLVRNKDSDTWWEDQPVEPEELPEDRLEKFGEAMRDLMGKLEKEVAKRVVTSTLR